MAATKKKTPVRRKARSQAPRDPEAPNITFVGHRVNAGSKDVKEGEEGFVPREPVKSISDGMDTLKLPTVDVQLAGPFYHPEATRIVALQPLLYKTFE